MDLSNTILCPRWRNFIITTLFCLLVSATTYTVWTDAIYVHLMISLGFGYSALGASLFISSVFPKISGLVETMISLTCSVVLGSINAWFWLNTYFGSNLSEFLPVVMLGIIFSGMCFYYFYNREQMAITDKLVEETKRKQAEQEKSLIQSQLMQMQSQIEPHFLFNTLANISALMSHDVPKARTMLDKLTELLRASLANSRLTEATVEAEVRHTRAYLAIQQIRLGERLSYTINVAPHLEQAIIPPMLIQPLVENAIGHGIEPKAEGGSISVEIVAHENKLVIRVTDDGVGFADTPSKTGHGVGLSNIKQRVKGLFGQQGSVAITQPKQGGFSVSISMPLKEHNQ